MHVGANAIAIYKRTLGGDNEEAPELCAVDFIAADSGTALRCRHVDGEQAVEISSVSEETWPRFLDALSKLRLAELDEQFHVPPDGMYVEIGIRIDGELRKFGWSGNLDDIPAQDRERFVVAWAESRAYLDRLEAQWQWIRLEDAGLAAESVESLTIGIDD